MKKIVDYLFSGESVIETKGANFVLGLDEHGLPKFGLFGLDVRLLLTGVPEKTESIGGHLFLTSFRLFFNRIALIGLTELSVFFCRISSKPKTFPNL